MPVRDHMSRVNKLRAKIITVDPSQRLIQVATADGGLRQISVWEVPTNFTWPVQDEQWTIYEENGYWYLGGKILNVEEDEILRSLSPGDSYTIGEGGLVGFKITDGAGDGKVLTSDSEGKASWQANPWSPGDIKMGAYAAADPGWLICDGSEKSRATYPALDAKIGTTYGAYTNGSGGAGTTHLRLPDFRGRGPVGSGTGDASGATAHTLGTKVGAQRVVLDTTQVPSHSHGVTDPGHTHQWSDSGFYINVSNENNAGGATGHYLRGAVAGTPIASNTTGISIQNTGDGLSHENRGPSTVVNFFIKT